MTLINSYNDENNSNDVIVITFTPNLTQVTTLSVSHFFSPIRQFHSSDNIPSILDSLHNSIKLLSDKLVGFFQRWNIKDPCYIDQYLNIHSGCVRKGNVWLVAMAMYVMCREN